MPSPNLVQFGPPPSLRGLVNAPPHSCILSRRLEAKMYKEIIANGSFGHTIASKDWAHPVRRLHHTDSIKCSELMQDRLLWSGEWGELLWTSLVITNNLQWLCYSLCFCLLWSTPRRTLTVSISDNRCVNLGVLFTFFLPDLHSQLHGISCSRTAAREIA